MSAEDLRRSSAQRLWILCAQIPRPLLPVICSPVQSCIRCHENPAALRVQADMRPDSVTYTTAAATNLRSGEWGGSVRNRIRFAVEVVRAIAHTIGAHRTALRISPSNPLDDMSEQGRRPPTSRLLSSFARLGWPTCVWSKWATVP